jgi:hypothetical protein
MGIGRDTECTLIQRVCKECTTRLLISTLNRPVDRVSAARTAVLAPATGVAHRRRRRRRPTPKVLSGRCACRLPGRARSGAGLLPAGRACPSGAAGLAPSPRAVLSDALRAAPSSRGAKMPPFRPGPPCHQGRARTGRARFLRLQCNDPIAPRPGWLCGSCTERSSVPGPPVSLIPVLQGEGAGLPSGSHKRSQRGDYIS